MSEESLAVAIEPYLTALFRPTDHIVNDPDQPMQGKWGVCVGSHGGDGSTLPEAMLKCLQCCYEPDGSSCGVGEFWTVAYVKVEDGGELLRDFFNRMCIEHMGTPCWGDTWKPK